VQHKSAACFHFLSYLVLPPPPHSFPISILCFINTTQFGNINAIIHKHTIKLPSDTYIVHCSGCGMLWKYMYVLDNGQIRFATFGFSYSINRMFVGKVVNFTCRNNSRNHDF